MNKPFEGIDTSTWLKGTLIVAQKHAHQVLRLDNLGQNKWTLIGKVQGTSKTPYGQKVDLVYYPARSTWHAEGFCTCPVGYNCKHVAALIQFAKGPLDREVHAHSSNTTLPWELSNWVSQWKSDAIYATNSNPLAYADTAKAKPPTHSLFYIFYASHQSLYVKLAKVRRNKSGWADNCDVVSKSALELLREPPSYVNIERDYPALKAIVIASVQDYTQSHAYRLHGPLGMEALHAIQQTQHTGMLINYGGHWAQHTLQLSETPAELGIDWEPVDNTDATMLRLCFIPSNGNSTGSKSGWTVSQQNQQLVLMPQPHLFDESTLTLTPVVTNLPTTQLLRLSTLPPVPESAFESIHRLLSGSIPEPWIAKLSQQSKIQYKEEAAQFRVRLSKLSLIQAHNPKDAFMPAGLELDNPRVLVLEVRYGELPWTGVPPVHKRKYVEFDGTRVMRNVEKEQSLLNDFCIDLHAVSLFVNYSGTIHAPTLRKAIANHPSVPSPAEIVQHFCRVPMYKDEWLELAQEAQTFCRIKRIQWTVDQGCEITIMDADNIQIDLEQTDTHWLEAGFSLTLGDRKLNLAELLTQLFDHEVLLRHALENGSKTNPKGHLHFALNDERTEFVRVPLARLSPLVEMLVKLMSKGKKSVKVPLHEVGLFQELSQTFSVKAEGPLYDLVHDFEKVIQNHQLRLSPAFTAQLRPYQREGVSWVQLLNMLGFNGLLADDMGLGKTVQTLAVLTEASLGIPGKPHLVIVPNSLIHNWVNESHKFAPSFRVDTLEAGMDQPTTEQLSRLDLLICPYSMVTRHHSILNAMDWHWLVVDESQRIKNANTQMAKALKAIPSRSRLALSGTPIENHLGELWSQMDFLMPDLLGSKTAFNQQWRNPIEKQGHIEVAQHLAARLKPFIRRRTKEQVAQELPEKTEQIIQVPLHPKQAEMYEAIRSTMDRRLSESLRNSGFAKSQILFLEALLRLRQVCCDPRLVDGKAPSAKLELLLEQIQTLVDEGRRILVFSQFAEMLHLIEGELDKLHIPCLKLTGQTKRREEVITAFEQNKAPVFLISLKAGGVGLNLVKADTVIVYDPWWNPAAEQQAIDRAHRIGQTKKVTVIRLIAEGTVEEKVLQLQAKKQNLADQMLDGQGLETSLTEEDFRYFLA